MTVGLWLPIIIQYVECCMNGCRACLVVVVDSLTSTEVIWLQLQIFND